MNIRLVIPVYNNQGLVEPIVSQALSETDLDILVVDDGSSVPIKIEDPSGRLVIHRFEKNQGKGLALQWAFKNSSVYTHIITMDGDGQHLVKDLTQFIDQIQSSPEALIIGARKFKVGVPGISRFGRKFSNFWVSYQTNIKVADSQSGFRSYPMKSLRDLKFYSQRYDFEIEVLVRAIWRLVPVKEIEIDVHYPSEDQRVSHFHKFWDNTRITRLNIFLIAYSLVFYQKSFIKLLLVGGLSVPLSFIPSFFLGILAAICICVVLRLNVILMLFCLLSLRMIV